MRVKGGFTSRRYKKRVMKRADGFYGSKSRCFKTANTAVIKSLQYAYRDRRVRRREFRSLWIVRIGAAARQEGLNYNQFIHGLAKAGIDLNRKVLADMAVRDEAGFKALAEQAKAQIKAGQA